MAATRPDRYIRLEFLRGIYIALLKTPVFHVPNFTGVCFWCCCNQCNCFMADYIAALRSPFSVASVEGFQERWLA